MSDQTTDLGEWVKQLLYEILLQPDEGLSEKVVASIDTGFDLRINGQNRTLQDWSKAILARRAKFDLTHYTCRELLAAPAADSRGGSVSHVFIFTGKNKETGDTNERSLVSVATVLEKNGTRVLTQLSEIIT